MWANGHSIFESIFEASFVFYESLNKRPGSYKERSTSYKDGPLHIKNGPLRIKNGPLRKNHEINLCTKTPILKPILTFDKKKIYVKIGYSGYDSGKNVLFLTNPDV